MSVRIALIDDDEDDLEFLRSALQKVDGDSIVSTFSDAMMAMDRLEGLAANNLPDVIIVDHQMPKMLGTELIKWIRSREDLEQCLIVMFSTDTAHITPQLEQEFKFTAIAKVNSYDHLMAVAERLMAIAKSKAKSES